MSLSEKLQNQLENLSLRIEREMYVVNAQGYVMAASKGDLPQAGDLFPLENEWTADTLWDNEKKNVYTRFIDANDKLLYLCIRTQDVQDAKYAFLVAQILKNDSPQPNLVPDRESSLRQLLLGHLSQAEVAQLAQEYHFPVQQMRCVMLVDSQPEHLEAVRAMMVQATASRREDWIVPITSQHVALVRTMHTEEEMQELHQLAHAIVDTLNNEYQLPVKAYIGLAKSQLHQLSESYSEAQQAGRMGASQYDEGPVFAYTNYLIEFFLENMPPATVEQFYIQVQGNVVSALMTSDIEDMVRALFKTELNISETARKLKLHRNTLLYRLDKIHRLTGLDLRKFDDAVIFKLLMQMGNYLDSIK